MDFPPIRKREVGEQTPRVYGERGAAPSRRQCSPLAVVRSTGINCSQVHMLASHLSPGSGSPPEISEGGDRALETEQCILCPGILQGCEPWPMAPAGNKTVSPRAAAMEPTTRSADIVVRHAAGSRSIASARSIMCDGDPRSIRRKRGYLQVRRADVARTGRCDGKTTAPPVMIVLTPWARRTRPSRPSSTAAAYGGQATGRR